MEISQNLPVKLGVLIFSDIKVKQSDNSFDELSKCADEYYQNYKTVNISKVPGVEFSRKLFRTIGLEPTKHRPSSEALLRRALNKKDLFSINNVVNISNWCALDFLLPNGIYDFDLIEGDITFRLGRDNESYEGLNRRQINLFNRYCLADNIGAFGSPITDSKRTAISDKTKAVFIVMYAPKIFPADKFEKYLELYSQRISAFCNGKLEKSQIF